MERQGLNNNSEGEAEGRVKSLPYKVRAASKESQTQRASLILDSDLRTHWSTGTNAKEWILLELEVSEPILPSSPVLSRIRGALRDSLASSMHVFRRQK